MRFLMRSAPPLVAQMHMTTCGMAWADATRVFIVCNGCLVALDLVKKASNVLSTDFLISTLYLHTIIHYIILYLYYFWSMLSTLKTEVQVIPLLRARYLPTP